MSPTRRQYVTGTHLRTLHDGTIFHRFSTELLAYRDLPVETLVYYRADDPRVIVTAHIDKYFYSALEKY
jgi:hypothetical protein